MKLAKLLGLITLAVSLTAQAAGDKAMPQNVGITVGSLGNPFFVATVNGARDKLREINPDVKVTAVSADYDLNKQFTQVENFIASGVDMILLNAVDPEAINPAVRKAKKEGIVVVAFDVGAAGVDATVMTDNVKAGTIACQAIVDRLGGEGNVIIINGPQVTSIVDRVKGCSKVFAENDGINVLSDNQNGKASRDGGFAVMQSLLTRFQDVDGVFGANDPTALGADLAAQQLKRNELIITGVDGAPDAEAALKQEKSNFVASASQDPYGMAQKAAEVAVGVLRGEEPEQKTILLDPKLITAENVDSYVGWNAHR